MRTPTLPYWTLRCCFIVTLASVCGCGARVASPASTRSTVQLQPRSPALEDRAALEDTVRALFAPFTDAHPGNLVVSVFDPEGASVFVVRGGEDAAREIYPLGSQAKLAVALAASQLEAEGRLDLDRPIGERMAGLPAEAAALSLRDLLTHHGGLAVEPPGWEPPRDYGGADLVADLEAHPPGERTYRYSNYGYMVAAHVMEQQLGGSFRDEVDRRVRRLLEGASGELGFLLDDELPRAALFDAGGEAPAPRVEPYLRWSCCLLEGNVTGLAALGQRLLTIRGPEARVLSPYRTLATGWGYAGMGMFRSSDGALAYNQGAMPGAYSTLAIDVREQRGVALVSATNGAGTGGLLLRTLALLRVLRGEVPAPSPTPALERSWRMTHPPDEAAWWTLRPEAFGLDGRGILVGTPHNTTLWLRHPLPPAGTIRMEVVPLTTSVDIKLDLLAPAMGLTAFGEDEVPGYRLILGGWNNTRSVLVAAPGEANVVWEDAREADEAPRFHAAQPIDVEVRYDAERLAVRVDGEPWFVVDRVDSGSGPRFLGIGGWSSAAAVRELQIAPASDAE